jgi:AraC family L-rhamnose operon transcriptional activator RhaR/AraC family L-rhamnose operon regulatory protein RhaS
MNHACSLLENTNLPVKEIAYKSGFYDSNYFIKLFKQQFGISPAKNRKSRNII